MEENPTVTGEFTGRYTIERELGRGGAAIVYLAHDNRQERHVALKVLHKELAQAIGAQRFLREIKHSSALQHPHLLTILDSGESRGTLYYVMPYMADGSLRTRIAKEKQLPIDEAIAITRDVGEALAYAHSHGIVHRDIKPDNVLFSGNRACLADFGIARAVDSVASDTLTSTGLVVGTPAYMSPEQASGEKVVDPRSDQYSLACLLYEMITGLPPFIGATQQSVISQRFTQPPPSLRVHRPNVPEHVERAVKRAMAVVPADRFPGVADFVAALHEPGAAAVPASVHSIRRRWFAVGVAAAIVTLAVVAARPGAEWVRSLGGAKVDTSKFVVLPFLSEGDSLIGARVSAALHTELNRWDGLHLERDQVVRDAVRERGRVTSLEQAFALARSLGAGRLVWGDVSQDGRRTTVKAELYDVGSRSAIRDTMFVGETVPADSSLRRILNSLLVAPSFPRGFDDGQDGTTSYAAWQAYGRGVVHLAAGRFEVARGELSRAVVIDSRFPTAQVWLAYVSSIVAPKEKHEWAPVAERALIGRERLRPRDALRADGLRALGKGDYENACNIFRSLVRGDSLDPHAWLALGQCLVSDPQLLRGRSPSGWHFRSSLQEAGGAVLRALELEPRLHSPEVFAMLQSAFMTSLNRLRTGVYVAGDSVWMYAYPVASGDTVAFVPYSVEATAGGRARADPLAHVRIVDRNRAVMLRAAQSWVSAYPQSADAFEALAGVLEARGQLTGGDPNTSALASVARARSLADMSKATSLAGTHVRLLVKAEDFVSARALADSVLQSLRGSEKFPEVQGAMSALTG
ncbi:MAG: protein kinase domain-containing protein, partial [Gemmatimonadaceae bacterium]